MATELVIQIPYAPFLPDLEEVDRFANLLDCTKREVVGCFSELAVEGTTDQAEDGTCAWFVDGFVSEQLSWGLSWGASTPPVPAPPSMETILSRAAACGVRRISVAPASVPVGRLTDGHLTYAQAINETSVWLKSVVRLFEQFGVDLCLRPAEGGFLTSPIELRELIVRINSPALGVDLSTRLLEGLAVWSDWFATLEPYVRSVRTDIDTSLENAQVRGEPAAVEEVIERICKPRSFGGVITVRAASYS